MKKKYINIFNYESGPDKFSDSFHCAPQEPFVLANAGKEGTHTKECFIRIHSSNVEWLKVGMK